MPYLDNVIKESMRLRPTSLAIPRTALVDHIVEGWKVPKGAIITMNIFEMGRDPGMKQLDPRRKCFLTFFFSVMGMLHS
jgi:cytochrome P450